MSAHHCHAKGCETPVPPRMLMCRKHWRLVPPKIQAAVWQTYRPGQEVDKRPSRDWQQAARAAIDFVAERESSRQRPAASADQLPLFPSSAPPETP